MEKLTHKIKVACGCIEGIFLLSDKEFSLYECLSRTFKNRSIQSSMLSNGMVVPLYDSYADVDLYSFFSTHVSKKKQERFHRIFDKYATHCIMSVWVIK